VIALLASPLAAVRFAFDEFAGDVLVQDAADQRLVRKAFFA